MKDGSLSFSAFLKHWEGYLPPQTVIMARRRTTELKLGSPEMVVPVTTAHASSEPTYAPNYRIAFETPGISSPAARELFEKIAAALGLGERDYVAAAEPQFEPVPAEFTIRFVARENDPSGWRGSTLTTYSLAAMLAKPELKKTVWSQLKVATKKT